MIKGYCQQISQMMRKLPVNTTMYLHKIMYIDVSYWLATTTWYMGLPVCSEDQTVIALCISTCTCIL